MPVEIATGAGHVRNANLDELFGVWNRQAAQPYGIEQLKQRRVGADAQRQRQDRDQRESRISHEQACAVAKVLDPAVEPHPPPHLSRGFLDQRDVAKLAPRRVGGGIRRLPALDAVTYGLFQMLPDLVVEVAVAARSPGHDSLVFRALRMPPTASTNCAQRVR